MTPSHRAASWLIAISMLLAANCSEDARSYSSIGACCVYDPVEHFASLYDCVDDADCVSGTACIDTADLDPEILEGWPHSAVRNEFPCPSRSEVKSLGKKVCAVPVARTGARQALTHGFHVAAFTLHPVTSDGHADPGAYTFEAPAETSIVQCALFACRPSVRTTSTDAEGRDLMTIVNYDQCVLAREVFSPGSGVFDLRNQDLEYHPPDRLLVSSEHRNEACHAVQSRRIAELSVGCWAFDSTQVIGATPLLPIDGRQIFNFQQAFVTCTEDKDSGTACFVGGTSRIGACEGKKCRDLCVDNHDCQSPASLGTAGSTDTTGSGAVDAGLTDGGGDAGPCDGGPFFRTDAGVGKPPRIVCIPQPDPSSIVLCHKQQDTLPPTVMGAAPNFVGVCIPNGG